MHILIFNLRALFSHWESSFVPFANYSGDFAYPLSIKNCELVVNHSLPYIRETQLANFAAKMDNWIECANRVTERQEAIQCDVYTVRRYKRTTMSRDGITHLTDGLLPLYQLKELLGPVAQSPIKQANSGLVEILIAFYLPLKEDFSQD